MTQTSSRIYKAMEDKLYINNLKICTIGRFTFRVFSVGVSKSWRMPFISLMDHYTSTQMFLFGLTYCSGVRKRPQMVEHWRKHAAAVESEGITNSRSSWRMNCMFYCVVEENVECFVWLFILRRVYYALFYLLVMVKLSLTDTSV